MYSPVVHMMSQKSKNCNNKFWSQWDNKSQERQCLDITIPKPSLKWFYNSLNWAGFQIIQNGLICIYSFRWKPEDIVYHLDLKSTRSMVQRTFSTTELSLCKKSDVCIDFWVYLSAPNQKLLNHVALLISFQKKSNTQKKILSIDNTQLFCLKHSNRKKTFIQISIIQ